jgi:hypothetical protein
LIRRKELKINFKTIKVWTGNQYNQVFLGELFLFFSVLIIGLITYMEFNYQAGLMKDLLKTLGGIK